MNTYAAAIDDHQDDSLEEIRMTLPCKIPEESAGRYTAAANKLARGVSGFNGPSTQLISDL